MKKQKIISLCSMLFVLLLSLGAKAQTPDTLAITGDSIACVGSYKTYRFTPTPGIRYTWNVTNSIVIGGTAWN